MLTTEPPRADGYLPSSPFWQGLREGRLVLQACRTTGRFQHPPRPISLATGSRLLDWREVSGAGAVLAWTRVFAAGAAAPGIVALIELDEGVRLYGRILEPDTDGIAVGQRVRLAWDTYADGTPYPAFRLAPATERGLAGRP